MGRTSCTDDEHIANLNRRATEAKNLAHRTKIEKVMRTRPSVIDALWEKLISLGFNESWLKEAEDGVKSFQAKAVETRKKRRAEDQSQYVDCIKAEAEALDSTDPDVPVDPVPPRANFLSDLTQAALRDKVVSGLGMANLSSASLKSIKDPEVNSKQGLLRILEFCSGTAQDFELKGKLRCYNRLTVFAREESSRRGERGVLLKLPPNWPEDGLARVVKVCENGDVEVQHRFAMEPATVRASDVPHHSNDDDLYIAFNWSEERFALASNDPGSQGASHGLRAYFQPPAVIVDDGAETSPLGERPRTQMLARLGSAASLGRASPAKVQELGGERTEVKHEAEAPGTPPAGPRDETPVQVKEEKGQRLNLDESSVPPPGRKK